MPASSISKAPARGRRQATGRRQQHLVLAVFNPGDQMGFMYSVNMPANKATIFVDNVPRAFVHAVTATINFLVDEREYHAGQTVASCGFVFRLLAVEGERRDELMQTHLLRADPGATVLEMKPLGLLPDDAVEKPTDKPAPACRECGGGV
jgi:hypothetical protein